MKFQYDPATVVSGYNNLLQRQLVNGNVLITGTTTQTAAGPPAVYSNIVSAVSDMSGLFTGMFVSAPGVFSPNTTITTVGPGNEFVVSTPPIAANPGIQITVTDLSGKQPNLARIYAFSYEGAYSGLPRPSMFSYMVPGTPVGNWTYSSTLEQSGSSKRMGFFGSHRLDPSNPTLCPMPTTPDDLYYWQYEKSDFSVAAGQRSRPLRTNPTSDGAPQRCRSSRPQRPGSRRPQRAGPRCEERTGTSDEPLNWRGGLVGAAPLGRAPPRGAKPSGGVGLRPSLKETVSRLCMRPPHHLLLVRVLSDDPEPKSQIELLRRIAAQDLERHGLSAIGRARE